MNRYLQGYEVSVCNFTLDTVLNQVSPRHRYAIQFEYLYVLQPNWVFFQLAVNQQNTAGPMVDVFIRKQNRAQGQSFRTTTIQWM